MRIKKVSQKLLKEAVMTLPWKISNGSIVLTIKGITELALLEDGRGGAEYEGETKYLSQCERKGVIPGSNLILKYISDSFVPDLDNEMLDEYDLVSIIDFGKPVHNTVIEGVTCNKKFYAIELRLEKNAPRIKEVTPSMFGDLLNMTLKNGYQIRTIDMWLDGIPADKDIGLKSGLQYGTPNFIGTDESKKYLELILTEPPKGSRTKLINWFNELSRKYEK